MTGPLDPGDADIRNAWDKWQQAVSSGYVTAAREWREMYLALLARRDRKQEQAADPGPETPGT